MDQSDRASRCPRCGAALSPDAHEGLCPACLFAAGSAPLSQASGEEPDPEKGVRPLFSGGERFGPYRIDRLLGRGGMGDVYEAEQIEQGRRVAIKVLSQRLNDPQDRARFLREGQLAASISHPHSVYIFGSEEIDGVPVIAMELLPGGTLKDRVARTGPLAPSEAVDAILQVIAGLDAAQAAGIRHRDIKPSNCFVDSAGGVKVGDFGLSISTLARDVSQVTIHGTFHGTPQFAAPEQLRGEPLDVRADIYAVGATLFYLLTGRAPFDDRDLMTLLARIASEPPPSPRTIAPGIPRALANIVWRCLAKDRAQRPASYAALDDELRPFSSAAPTPATLGLRFLAAVIDGAILSLPSFPLMMSWSANLYAPRTLAWITGVNALAQLSYFGVLEGLWGAAIGKWVCGLRVVGPDGNRPGVARAVARALFFEIPGLAGGAITLWVGPLRMFQLAAHPGGTWLTALPYYGGLAALCSTMRRRNGFAGLHELATGTRVIQRTRRNETRIAIDLAEPAPVATHTNRQVGPFDLVGELGATDQGRLFLGFDRSLRRSVWVHVLPSDTPAVVPLLRDLSRPGRLRWLNGQRAAGDAWDAYEALDGAPLASLIDGSARQHQPWRSVRFWLLDLAREIDAGLHDGSLSALTLDRVWITRDGRAKLLDFTPPGVSAVVQAERVTSFTEAQAFLDALAGRALDRSSPLPLSAEALLSSLDGRRFATPAELATQLATLANRADCVGRWRRAIPMALCAAPGVLMVLTMVIVMPMVRNMIPKDAMELSQCLSELGAIRQNATGDQAHKREILETYVAGRFGPMIASVADTEQPANPLMAGLLGPHRAEIQRIRADYPRVSPEQTAHAAGELEPTLKRFRQAEDATPGGSALFFSTMFFFAVTAVCGVVSSWVFRGGWLLRALGIAVVVQQGREASRVRTLVRGLIAWWPVPVIFYIFSITLMFIDSWSETRAHPAAFASVLALSALFVVGAVYAVLNPERGWQDRLAGTWLVPR